jgi:hypothetical protein
VDSCHSFSFVESKERQAAIFTRYITMNPFDQTNTPPHIILPDDEDFPFDEKHRQHPQRNRAFYPQTSACMRALSSTTQVQARDGTMIPIMPPSPMRRGAEPVEGAGRGCVGSPAKRPALAAVAPLARSQRLPLARSAPPSNHNALASRNATTIQASASKHSEEDELIDEECAVDLSPMLSCNAMDNCPAATESISPAPAAARSYESPDYAALTLGPPKYKVFKTSVPDTLLPLISPLISRAEEHAAARGGWFTNLYSLTKQDLPVAEIPGGISLVQPLTDFVVLTIQQLYRTPRGQVPIIRMDTNQPHVLKYDGNHKGVPLHHDRCDVTAQLMLSLGNGYSGGGTYFADMDMTVRLERGDLLLHPGPLVHSGLEITGGSRLLLVWFAHLR